MTPEETNSAIAEACGWTEIEQELERFGIHDLPNGELRGINRNGDSDIIPNYYHDLNACHEMEKIFSPSYVISGEIQGRLWAGYINWLRILTKDRNDLGGLTVHACAPQRCEAFLRTINKWKD
jgi:hypothetical protein